MELKEVKSVMANKKHVSYGGIEYDYVNSCILKYDKKAKSWYYLLELMDYCLHSVTVVHMEDVEIVTNKAVVN